MKLKIIIHTAEVGLLFMGGAVHSFLNSRGGW